MVTLKKRPFYTGLYTTQIKLNEDSIASPYLSLKRANYSCYQHLLSLQGMSHKTSVPCTLYLQKENKKPSQSHIFKRTNDGRYMVLVKGKEWLTITHSKQWVSSKIRCSVWHVAGVNH